VSGPGLTERKPRAHRTRRITAWVLVVLVSLLIPVAVISVWAIRTVTDTNQYVATMAPLARNEIIVTNLASKATDELMSSHVVQDKVTAALPKSAKPLVTPIVNQVHVFVYDLSLKVLDSANFARLWDGLNRRSQEAVVDVLTGKQTRLTKKIEKGGAIVIDVTPTMTQIINQADAHGVTLFDSLKPKLDKADSLSVTILSKQQVSEFSGAFNLIVKLRWIIPVVALVLAALGIGLAVDRRKTLLRMAIGVTLVTVVLLAGLSLGRITFLNGAAKHKANREVAGAFWDTLLRFLETDLRWTLLVSVLVAFGAWVAGPARYAVSIRVTCAKGWRWLARQARELMAGAKHTAAGSERAGRSGRWILEHINGLRIFGVIVAGLFVVFGGNLTGWSILLVVFLVAAYLALIELVAIWARKVSAPVP
jgi:hypothetical protein